MDLSGGLEDRTFSEVKRLCHGGLDGPGLLGGAIERLRRAVPFDAYCASTVDPASGLITHAIAREMGGEKEAAIFFEHLYFEYDLDQLGRMVQSRRPVELLSRQARGDLARSPRYQRMLEPLGLANEARAVFAVGGSPWGTADLSREAGQPDFGSREISLLKRLAPHLGAGLKAAALRFQAATGDHDEPDVPGVINLDRRGQVVGHTPAAEHWLKEIGDLDPNWREGAVLPAAIHMVSGALHRALSPGSDKDLGSVPRLRVRTRHGRWLTLYGSLTEASPTRPSETVIVIEPTKPHEISLFNMSAYGLSPREEELAKLVARGETTRQISTTLHISEYTVQNHLQNVFEKVGVRSRRELLRRIFFDNLYPTIFE